MKIFKSVITRRTLLLAFSAAIIGGCTDFSDPPPQLGHLNVSLKDETGAGVGGIPVDLLLNDRSTVWGSLRTSSDGTGEFRAGDGGVIPQGYIVRVVLAGTSYKLAANETNDKPIQVVIGQTHTANFVLTKSAVGQNPG
jgi:hypothetical protein